MLYQIAPWIKWIIKEHLKLPFGVRSRVNSGKPRSNSEKSIKFWSINSKHVLHVTVNYSLIQPPVSRLDTMIVKQSSSGKKAAKFYKSRQSSFIAWTAAKKICFCSHFASTVSLDMRRKHAWTASIVTCIFSHSLSRVRHESLGSMLSLTRYSPCFSSSHLMPFFLNFLMDLSGGRRLQATPQIFNMFICSMRAQLKQWSELNVQFAMHTLSNQKPNSLAREINYAGS